MTERPEDAPATGPTGRGPASESDVWSIISTLVAGPAVWGALGYGADALAGTSTRWFTAFGVVIGFVTSIYIVYVRHGRDPRPSPSPGDRR